MSAEIRPNGALLDKVKAFLARFVAFPSEDALIATTLWVAHTHLMDSWESTPRIAFLSPEPGSGKTRALEVLELLVPRPIHATNTTPAYLFRKVSDEAGAPTILYDEIDTVFGPKAKDNEDIRGMLNSGHRRGAMAGRCVVRGKVVETEELPSYCAVALAGLGHLPDTILNRSVIIKMRRRTPDEKVEPFRRRVHEREGEQLRGELAAWARHVADHCREAWPEMPEGIEDRNADVWEALFAVADVTAAGQKLRDVTATDWPIRARVAAVTLVTDLQADSPSLGIKLLSDLRDIFDETKCVSLATHEVLTNLKEKEGSPWADLGGKPLDSRSLAYRLQQYEIRPTTIRTPGQVLKGYPCHIFEDAWKRYLPERDHKSVTAVTPLHDEHNGQPQRGRGGGSSQDSPAPDPWANELS